MLFADTDLARRLEEADCQLLREAGAARKNEAPGNDAFLHEMAGGVASFIRPGSPLNKLAGLGFGGAVDEADLDLVEEAFESRGAALQAEVSSLADPAVAATLTRRGYAVENCENVLACSLPLADLPSPSPEFTLSSQAGEPSQAWLDVITNGFASPDIQGVASHEEFPRDVLERTIRDLSRAEGFLCYQADRGGELASAASLRLYGGLALLAGAATLPAHRRRGAQSALLSHRLRDAADKGCDLAVVVTQPGSKSQQNVQKLGFELLYTRLILVREAP